ncbi:MAG TPA: molecular chaperone TorD family protein [Candidatus Sulfotelmatobacter sp.]|nr:molecular chaperone TorD family protein [Candidatus Sulfotelmatobacter sp.]
MPIISPEENTVISIDWQQNDLYRFFALVFAPPTRKCFGLLSQPALPKALRNLWQHLKCEGEYPGFEWFASYEQYESTYIALFDVGIPEPPVPLFESAHDKSHPAQEIALENTYFYDVLGLKSDPGRAVPDYLVTQLEFLAALRYTCEHTSEESSAVSLARAETEFLERHLLTWLPAAKAKLGRTNAPGFPLLMTMLVQFLGRYTRAAEAPRSQRF